MAGTQLRRGPLAEDGELPADARERARAVLTPCRRLLEQSPPAVRLQGGASVVAHDGEPRTFRCSSANRLTLIAFYADCVHEVRPVREGYRVALTYNLMVDGDAVPVVAPEHASPTTALARAIERHFDSPVPPRWSSDRQRPPPDRLVYLLDHEYTQRGLAWSRLKRTDAARAAALLEVARRDDYEIFLALADVHESWSWEEEGWGYRRRRSRYWRDEDWEEEDDSDAVDREELGEHFDTEIALSHWVGVGGRIAAEGVSGVIPEEVRFTRPSVELEHYASEHTPYMGNWGNTADRWYHRAAVVMWPRERAFVLRAQTSARWAVAEIERSLRDGDGDQARHMARSLLPFWRGAAYRETRPGFASRVLRVAEMLADPELASELVGPLRLAHITIKRTPLLLALRARFGLAWLRPVLKEWASERDSTVRRRWLADLPGLVQALCELGGAAGQGVARCIVAEHWPQMVQEHRSVLDGASPSAAERELGPLTRPILGLLQAAHIAGDKADHRKILRALNAIEEPPGVYWLVALLREAHRSLPPDTRSALGLGELHARTARVLEEALDTPPRQRDDWSIRPPGSCSCERCRSLAAFLTSPHRVAFEWPLAKQGRMHVHRTIDRYELPVTHTTRRSGRPYTLVLTKTKALFQHDKKERTRMQRDLAWLRRTQGAGATGRRRK